MEATSSCCISALPTSLASVTTPYPETVSLGSEVLSTRLSGVEIDFRNSLLPKDEVLERFSTSIHQRDSDKLVDEVMCVVRRSMEQQQTTTNTYANINNDTSNENYVSGDYEHYKYDNSKCNSASEIWEQNSFSTHYARDDLPLPVRLSRHIPQRDEMNMAISSFNLLQPTSTPMEAFSAHHNKRIAPFASSSSSSLYNTMRSQPKEQEQSHHHHHHHHYYHQHEQQQQERYEQTNLPSRMSLSAPVSPSSSMAGPFAGNNNINKLELLSFTASPLQSLEKTNHTDVQKNVDRESNTENTINSSPSSSFFVVATSAATLQNTTSSSFSSSSPPATTHINKNHVSEKSILSLSHLASYRRQMNHNKRPKSVSLTAGFAGVCLSQPVMSSKQRRARDASHSSFTPPSSECASLVESFISDDSSHLTSLYNEMLVDHLNSSSNTTTTTTTTNNKKGNKNSSSIVIEPNLSEMRSCQHERNKRRVESCHDSNSNHICSRTTDNNETENVLGGTTTSLTDGGGEGNAMPFASAPRDGIHLHSTFTDQNEQLCPCEERNSEYKSYDEGASHFSKNGSCTSGRNRLKLQIYGKNEEKRKLEVDENDDDEDEDDVNILSQHHRRRRRERCNGPNRVGGNVFAFSPNWDGLDDRYQNSRPEGTLFKSISLQIPSISSASSLFSSTVTSNTSSPFVNHESNFTNSFTNGTSKYLSSNKGNTCKLEGSFSHSPTESARQLNANVSFHKQHHQHQIVPRIHKILHSSHKKTNTRPFYPNPECVLDAPEFPSYPSQLLHWGSNNKVVLGLKNVIYTWDAETRESNKLTELLLENSIRFVQWIHKAQCVAVGGCADGKTSIFDCRSQSLLRSVHLPEHMALGQVTVNGPLLAISAHPSANMPYIGVFDLRVKNALIASHSLPQHDSAEAPSYVTSLKYCHAEPFYLASGWSDGTVRIWDARRCNAPKYFYPHIHSGVVGAVQWNPSKRTRLFTGGGEDGVLCQINTHASFSEGRLSSDSNEEINNVLCSTMNSHSSNYSNSSSVFALNSPLPLPSLSSLSPVVSLPSSASISSLGATQYVTVKSTPNVFVETRKSDNNSATGIMDRSKLEEEVKYENSSHSNSVNANETIRSQRSLTTQNVQLYQSGSSRYSNNNNNNNVWQCHSCIVGAVNTMYPITGMTCSADGQEVLTSHRNKGQLQLRRANDFHLMCVYKAHKCDADITCISLAPDKERVCASQADESLKFWRVFAHDETKNKSSGKESATMTMMPRSKLHSQLDDKLRESKEPA